MSNVFVALFGQASGATRAPARQAARVVLAVLGLSLVVFGPAAHAQKYRGNTSAAEIAQLPKYCYAQYVSEKLSKDPIYSLSPACGAFMNHLCPGLVALIRAKKPTAQGWQRGEAIAAARRDFAYTLDHMPPSCSMRAEVEAYAQEADKLAATIR